MPILACVHTFYNNANKNTKLVAKIPRLPCAHTLHNNTNINIKARFQNSQSYMCTYPLQKQKHKHKSSFPKCPFLSVYKAFTTKQTYTQCILTKIPSLTCVHTLYNNKNIHTNAWCLNSQAYMCTYTLKKHKHNVSLPKFSVLHVYIPSTTPQT